MMTEHWIDEVLAFWFAELTEEDWFMANAETDRAVRERFEPLNLELRRAVPAICRSEARAALAAIIALDQFPRNIWRGKAEAFATDDQAIDLARNAVERGLDQELAPRERMFLYMPFMHSEILADQERSVDLFKALGNENSEKYAIEHRDIVARFGRFPHRNRTLGRQSSAAEEVFLAGHKGFGQ